MQVQISKLAIIESLLLINDETILRRIEELLPEVTVTNDPQKTEKFSITDIQDQLDRASLDLRQDKVYSTKLMWDCFKQ